MSNANVTIAVDSRSPFRAFGAFMTNAQVALTAALLTLFILTFFKRLETKDAFPTAELIFTGVVTVSFFYSLVKSSKLQRARYKGLLKAFYRQGQWRLAAPIEYMGHEDQAKLLELFSKASEGFDSAPSEEASYVILLGRDSNENLKLGYLHYCEVKKRCETPEIHILGYNKNTHGAIKWV